ncbi:hypothetical protein BCR39DRAFT_469418 [Naematelia encephala]|uniref:Secreted protein n=1 Tax=Naematelia encephala TaxID=71784 RepID=A0A1Y2AXN2_9TREE|nr:hypothetical protein BCR39DRAFT_469418 [Naematelia encephala]
MKLTIFLLATVLSMAANVKADYYANFYDDDGCKINGGEGVSIKNPGCLTEPNRGSVYIPNTGLGTLSDNQFCLVKTHYDGSCSCQNEGYDFTATGFCAVLDPSYQSYRFISGGCASNNC